MTVEVKYRHCLGRPKIFSNYMNKRNNWDNSEKRTLDLKPDLPADECCCYYLSCLTALTEASQFPAAVEAMLSQPFLYLYE